MSPSALPTQPSCLLFFVLLLISSSLDLGQCHLSPADTGDVTDDSAAAPARTKRYSNFVRVGRQGGTFVRIGKNSGPFDGSDAFSGELQSPLLENIDYPSKRQMHRFIRIGRDMEDDSGNGYLTGMDNVPFARIEKSPSSFVRIGKSPSSFVRIGKSPSSFVRIGKSPSSFVRIGKAPNNFLRIGKASFDSPSVYDDKRASSFVRIGRSVAQSDDTLYDVAQAIKKASSFVRIGKSSSSADDSDQAKRVSSFVRIGKSHLADTDFGDHGSKRTSSFVRIGKSSLVDDDFNANMLKRPSSFVRIGKSTQPQQQEQEGNGSPFADRLLLSKDSGLSSPDKDAEKRGFVRIGKKEDSKSEKPVSKSAASSPQSSDESSGDGNLTEDEGPINVASRGSAFVRIGKIPSSAFVRIGKNTDVVVEKEPGRVYPFSRGSRGGHSSFVRIG